MSSAGRGSLCYADRRCAAAVTLPCMAMLSACRPHRNNTTKTLSRDNVDPYLCCCLSSSIRPLIEALSAATAAMTAGRLWQEAGTDRLLVWCRKCRREELAAAGPALLLSRRAIPGDASCSSSEDLEEAGKSDSQHDVANTAAIESLSAMSQCTVRLQRTPNLSVHGSPAPVIQMLLQGGSMQLPASKICAGLWPKSGCANAACFHVTNLPQARHS